MATFEMAIQVEKGLGPFQAAGKLKQRQGVGRTTEESNASRLLSCDCVATIGGTWTWLGVSR